MGEGTLRGSHDGEFRRQQKPGARGHALPRWRVYAGTEHAAARLPAPQLQRSQA